MFQFFLKSSSKAYYHCIIHQSYICILRSPPWHGQPLWNICGTNDHGYVPLVVNTSLSFPHSWLITGFVTRLSSGISHQLRDIFSKCRCCRNFATYKWKVHNGKIEIISFVVMFRYWPTLTADWGPWLVRC
jgi:hypothetical protein